MLARAASRKIRCVVRFAGMVLTLAGLDFENYDSEQESECSSEVKTTFYIQMVETARPCWDRNGSSWSRSSNGERPGSSVWERHAITVLCAAAFKSNISISLRRLGTACRSTEREPGVTDVGSYQGLGGEPARIKGGEPGSVDPSRCGYISEVLIYLYLGRGGAWWRGRWALREAEPLCLARV